MDELEHTVYQLIHRREAHKEGTPEWHAAVKDIHDFLAKHPEADHYAMEHNANLGRDLHSELDND